MRNCRSSEKLQVETEIESDGRWIAEAVGLPGVLAYGQTEKEAVRNVEALAERLTGKNVRTALSEKFGITRLDTEVSD